MAIKKFSSLLLPLLMVLALVVLPIISGRTQEHPCQDYRLGCKSRDVCNAKCLSLGYVKGGDCVTFAFPICCCKINFGFQDDSPISSPIFTD
ncbi:Defensin-like (DEFL) family protein [Arabidopsis thaliana]|uniref:Defensin-like protein 82 n=1 Tax=Arabidopsis thaliana TaxID=3702 RepID=DEF82_ARATH|nr:Defensin-like (DEFL) family protein [Arabidopsis thaliana]Q2V334.1 RecName: Full=Defensin-like protein 82; Flags: Precursor [Arabidopsis thaliana]AED93888.1 Defensin-like (DEFL) family protein [Arabidopsis thaliana]|eukprot:NP_001031965.1 Defensin-like (DEFL) family protein [Arabidopsis thaliana]